MPATLLLIANAANGEYDRAQRTGVERVRELDLADVERRVRAGEWLRPGLIAKLLGVGRTKMHTLLTSGVIGSKTMPASTHRVCNPVDVVRELDADDPEQPHDASPRSGRGARDSGRSSERHA